MRLAIGMAVGKNGGFKEKIFTKKNTFMFQMGKNDRRSKIYF